MNITETRTVTFSARGFSSSFLSPLPSFAPTCLKLLQKVRGDSRKTSWSKRYEKNFNETKILKFSTPCSSIVFLLCFHCDYPLTTLRFTTPILLICREIYSIRKFSLQVILATSRTIWTTFRAFRRYLKLVSMFCNVLPGMSPTTFREVKTIAIREIFGPDSDRNVF